MIKITFKKIIYLILIITVCIGMYFYNQDIVKTHSIGIIKEEKANVYTGIVMRKEYIYKSKKSGYIKLLKANNSKIKTGDYIYCIAKKNIFNKIKKSKNNKINFDVDNNIISEYLKNYNNTYFNEVYNLKQSLKERYYNDDYIANVKKYNKNLYLKYKKNKIKSDENNLTRTTKRDLLSYNFDNKKIKGKNKEIFNKVKNKKNSFKDNKCNLVKSPRDGILSYEIDDLENLRINQINKNTFNQTKYKKINTLNKYKIKKNEKLYKLIDQNKFDVCINLDNVTYKYIKNNNLKKVKVKFLKDCEYDVASIKLKNVNNLKLAILSFKNSNIRYINDRYLKVSVILSQLKGLKIPKKYVVNKKTYCVPLNFVNNKKVRLVENNKINIIKVEICFIDFYKKYMYIYSSKLNKYNIIKNKYNKKYTIKKIKNIKGVYCLNKNNKKEFKHIDVLSDYDKYYIVKENILYGVKRGDNIILSKK